MSSIDPVRPVEVELHDEAVAEISFYIPATGTATRPRRTLKYGDTFAVFDSHGDMGASAGGADGLFHKDTRYLSRLELLLNNRPLLLLGSNLRDDNGLLSVDLTNPDFYEDDQIVLQKDLVHVARTIFLWRGTAYQRLAVRNYGDRTINVSISLLFKSDFADLFEVRGLHRARRGVLTQAAKETDRVVLSYRGLDDAVRTTTVAFDPVPAELDANTAIYRLELKPGEMRPLFLIVSCNAPEDRAVLPFARGMLQARRELRSATQEATSIETSNEVFNEVLCRSAADLNMLMTDTPEGRYPYAGIPWYSTTFGRDGLITALQMLWCDPGVARGVLRHLAAYQAHDTDAQSDAEPGKILHEMRHGEMAALGEVPFGLYYGSVDATILFVLLAGLYFERTGDVKALTELWPAIEAALAWIDGAADRDGDGFIEYAGSERGLVNQGWKDSADAVFHADGRLATGPIALAEVQAYVFAAKRLIARCARRLGYTERANVLEEEARRLAERFEAAFWRDDLQMYALALDGAKEPCCVRTSNAGQVLFTGIARPDHAATVASTLLAPDLFSGWGIRTVSRREVRYNPMSYHNGSVWPHDNALVAAGLAQIGAKSAVNRIFKGLFDAATYMDLLRLPELFCGFQRARNRGPTRYPVACAPQAWASAAPFCLLQAALGLEIDPTAEQLRLRNPQLPKFLDEVTLRNLQVGDSKVDIAIKRDGESVSVSVLRAIGAIEVSVLAS